MSTAAGLFDDLARREFNEPAELSVDAAKISVEGEDLPTERAAGAATNLTFNFTHDFTFIDPGDPDYCFNLNTPVAGGLSIEMVAAVDGVERARRTVCLPATVGVIHKRSLSINWPLDPGSHTLKVTFFTGGSEDEIATIQKTITTPEQVEAEPCTTDADCPAGFNCFNGTCEPANGGAGLIQTLTRFIEGALGVDLPGQQTTLLLIAAVLLLLILR